MNSFRSLIYTAVGIVIFLAVAKFFITLLPYLIVLALVIYIVSKVKKSINRRNNNSQSNTYEANGRNNYNTQVDDDYSGEVVDVDYEEVNK